MMKEYKAYINKANREGFRNLFKNYAEEDLSAQDIDAIILSEAAYALGEQETEDGMKVFSQDVHNQICEMLATGIGGKDLFPLLVLMLDGNSVEITFKDGTGVEGDASVGIRSFKPNASPKSFTVNVPIFENEEYLFGEDENGDYEDDDMYDEDSSEIMDADENEECEDEEYDSDEYDEDEDEEYEDDSYIIHDPDDPTVIWPADEDEKPPVVVGTWKYSVKISRIDEMVALMDWDEG